MKLTNGSVVRSRLNPGPFGDVEFTRHHSSRQSYGVRALGPSSITPTPSPPKNRLLKSACRKPPRYRHKSQGRYIGKQVLSPIEGQYPCDATNSASPETHNPAKPGCGRCRCFCGAG